MGHSMGGHTIRTLVELLENGSEEEREYFKKHPEEGISPLFEGEKKWVHSVTTIATPHNGTTMADQEMIIPLLRNFLTNIAITAGISSEKIVYDFKLDQWGIRRKAGESFTNYLNRVLNSSIWKTDDVSAYDVSTKGSQELNQWVKTSPNVYYFSHLGNATYKGVLTGHYYPIATMNPILISSSMIIGSYTRKNEEPIIDKSWFPNDGLANVVSSKYPFGHANQPYHPSKIEKGIWYYFPTMEGWDHMDFIGILGANTPGYKNIYGFYHEMAEQLHKLPK